MKYRVIIQPRAFNDLDVVYEFLEEKYSAETAVAWYESFIEAIFNLDNFAKRCSLAAENAVVDFEIRQMLHRRHGSVYRALFTIRDDAVRVIAIRHSSQRDLQARELEE